MEQLKKGYKKTEVGVIPADWIPTYISQIAKITTGASDTQDKIEDGQYPFFVRSQNIERINKYSFNCEAILTSGDGVGVGKIYHYIDGKFDFHQRVYCLYDYHPLLHGKYLFYQFSTNFYNRVMAMTAKSSVDSVRREMISNMLIAIPPTLTEQKAIAEALTDVDELITNLEKFIAKKKAIKQGAMQQLLTPPHKGGKRLGGFSGDWVEVRLGDLSQIKTGGKNNQDKVKDGEYPFFVRSQNVEKINSYCYDGEAILIPGEGGIGTIFHYINGKFDVHQRVYKISDFESNCFGKFIYLKLLNGFYNHAMKNSVKATVDSLRLPTFLEFKIELPPTLDEQIAISKVVFDLDFELEMMEKKMNKCIAIKQGMMQELLTGKTRLI